jgi:hypothetical protein
MPKKPPRNIKEYIGGLSDESPDAVISKIKVELEPFIDKVVNSGLTDLYLVGRKSRHLFHAALTSRKLVENNIGIHFLNISTGKVHGGKVCVIYTNGPFPKEISLLADSVDAGEEKEEIINIMKSNGTKIKKLFCFIAKKDGITYLTTKGILSADQIIAQQTLSSEEYSLFNNRLEAYYQSRIEPMDIDHQFLIRSAAKKISKATLRLIFKEAIRSTLTCEKGVFSEAVKVTDNDEPANILFVPDSIVNFNFECYEHLSEPATPNNCTLSKLKDVDKLSIEYIQVRLKAKLTETMSTISVMAFCPLDPKSTAFDTLKTGKCFFAQPKCILRTFIYDKTQFKKNEVMSITCPQCVENRISSSIVEKVIKEIMRLVESK